MAYTYEELKHKTVAELREIAAGVQHEAVQGATQLNKDQLLPRLCQALGIDTHAHHQVVGIDKAGIKGRIKALKKERLDALTAHDHGKLKLIRRQIHRLKRTIRKATV